MNKSHNNHISVIPSSPSTDKLNLDGGSVMKTTLNVYNWMFQRWLKVLGDEPEGVGLAEIGLLIQSSSPQCGGKPHEERDAKVSEAETQFCQNMWVDTFLNCKHMSQDNSKG